MQYGYLIMREDIEDSDESKWGYPQYCYRYPVLFCKHKSVADMKIIEFYQKAADEFMDWLDIEKENVEKGYYDHIDISWCPLEWYEYVCYAVPYYNEIEVEAPMEKLVFNNRNIEKVVGCENGNIIRNTPMKFQREEPE